MKPPGFRPADEGLSVKAPGLGLEREPEAGLPGPPKAGLGFQPGPDFLSGRGVKGLDELAGREAESALGRGVKEPSPSSRLKGRLAGPAEERPAGLSP